MRRATTILVAVVLGVVLAGCGEGSQVDPQAVFTATATAMAGVSGYRIHGSIVTEETGPQAVPGTGALSMEVTGEVQVVEGVTRQHLTASDGARKIEVYIVGTDNYRYSAEEGWTYAPAPSSGGSALDAQRIELVASTAESIEVIEDSERTIGLATQLGEEYFRAVMDAYIQQAEAEGQPVSEEWRAQTEASLGSIQAVVRLWIYRDTSLIKAMDMDYAIGGEDEGTGLSSTTHFDLFDYNAPEIVVELPPEAQQAKQASTTTP